MKFAMEFDKEHAEVCQGLARRELRRYAKVVRDHCDTVRGLTTQKHAAKSGVQVNHMFEKPQCGIPPSYLIRTGSANFDKTVISVVMTCAEIDELLSQGNILKQVQDYGEFEQNVVSETQLSTFLPVLRQLSSYVLRHYDMIKFALKQIAGLLSTVPHDTGAVQVIFSKLQDLLVNLMLLDRVVFENNVLKEHMKRYLKLLKSICYEEYQSIQTKALLKLLTDMEKEMFVGTIFRNGITNSDSVNPKTAEALQSYIRASLTEFDSTLSENSMNVHLCSSRFVAICAMYALHYYVKKQTDRHLFKSLCDTSKKVGPVYLLRNIVWTADDFFLREVTPLGKVMPNFDKSSYLDSHIMTKMLDEVVEYESQITTCIINIDREFNTNSVNQNNSVVEVLKRRLELLMAGCDLIQTLNKHINLVVNFHVWAGKAMVRSTAVLVVRMICALMSIRKCLVKHQDQIAESLVQISQYLRYQALELIYKTQKRFTSDRASERDKKLESTKAALRLAEICLRGSLTSIRQVCLQLFVQQLQQAKFIRQDEITTLTSIVKQLGVVCSYYKSLRESIDLRGLGGHHTAMLKVVLDEMYKNNSTVTSSTVFGSLSETVSQDEKHQLNLAQTMNEFISKIVCRDIETDLRLQMHSNLVTDTRNPLAQNSPKSHNQMKRICQTDSLRLAAEKTSIKFIVEKYLQKLFYNLTTVALHDWGTYDEMKLIAQLKFGTQALDSQLPAETLDQGLDVLTVMRGVGGFSSSFAYNMNNQIFVEKHSNNKHLNSVCIEHIANSIRTHGPGMTNTTVNIVYKYLKAQFTGISQFLYDEHIKSKLIRDTEYFEKRCNELNQKYPYDRAEKFCKSIRKLGVTTEGYTYLDKLRQLITSVGNAMGYVRMVRTGAMKYSAQCNNAMIPSSDEDRTLFQDIPNVSSFQNQEDITESLQHFESLISSLSSAQNSENGADNVDYYQVLIKAFQDVFLDKRNSHLQNFYILVPSLTINYTDNLVQSRERLYRKSKSAALFTDDGFAIGVSYMLRLTEQFNNFDSLHWFQSVNDKYENDLSKSNSTFQRSSTDEKLGQTLTLTAKRFEAHLKEFTLLDHSLTSARIFFKTN